MVDPNDPFAGPGGDAGDRTVVKPRPGGRAGGTGQMPSFNVPGPAPAAPQRAAAEPVELPGGGGINPLERAAAPLLALVHRLRHSLSHPDPVGLRTQIAAEIRAFEGRAREGGATPEQVFAARYVLCTLLDEVAMATPWGATSGWSTQSLLVAFHNEAWGGEKVFLLLEKLLQDPRNNLDMLELIYVALALGFEGRYHVLPNGRSQLDELRERLFRTLRTVRGDFERELAVRWRPAPVQRNPLTQYVPLWALGAFAGAVLLGLFLYLRGDINAQAEPVFTNIHALGENLGALVTRPAAPPALAAPAVAAATPAPSPLAAATKPLAAAPRLATFLAEEIRQGLVTVDDRADRSVVTIRGDGLFASGSATVKDNYRPLLSRIAQELKKVPGDVLITGHTDNRPIATLRFPSNWKLSQERAQSVLLQLSAETGQAERFTAEGRADTEPVAPNDSNDNRAKNRRVEITLFAPGTR
ncbi:type VI secretion system protein ImpK [Plasticicumulans lactativorans]|uniref:Type VI secretion system protein ImpK n=1 Tax=Plasticicumulans lactativorans TaxID=1133106 RepID=A0A4R2KUL0_9GAMM|nr:DotU family type VI secretion system protein [Plasticicumulans lactativorans]TCO78111.1 type VI secretion system protein ImpK [Plasticicumulans lactativorans]